MIRKLFIITVLTIMSATYALAQCGAYNDAIKPGEKLSYELKFNWKFIWINAGWAKMSIDTTMYGGRQCLKTSLESYTNKRIDFFFKMRDTLVSVTTPDLVPLYFRKGAEEGKKYTIDNIEFGYKNGKCIVDQYRKYKDRTITQYDESEVCVYDMLSIMLQARSYDASDYNPGDKIQFSMATGKKIEKQTLIYRGKKNCKAENDITYRCLVFSLVEYNKKNEEKEVITFFVTDDKNHLPIRLDMYLNFGSAKAFLTEIEGNKYPITCIVEE